MYWNILKWIATTMMVVGATVISLSPEWSIQFWPFIFFLTGHIIWGYYGILIKDFALTGLNLGFIPLDIYAIVLRV